jgi:predicted HAD superfamily Cof-like phosphohydrolase
MHKLFEQVREFHKAFGHPAPNTVGFKEARLLLRCNLILEEATEFFAAAGYQNMGDRDFGPTGDPPDMVKMVDGLIDLLYVTYGTLVELGCDPELLADEVHRSNMAKLGPDGKPITRDDGKTLKPAGWTPPDLERVLRLMGFDTCQKEKGDVSP